MVGSVSSRPAKLSSIVVVVFVQAPGERSHCRSKFVILKAYQLEPGIETVEDRAESEMLVKPIVAAAAIAIPFTCAVRLPLLKYYQPVY